MRDIVYVKADEHFSAADNPQIAEDLERMNRGFLERGENYVLIGPGRWGSSDPWLGIPVKWPHISAAKLIMEAELDNYHVDQSQGTHFFQNLTSLGVGYFSGGLWRKDMLDAMPATEETEHVRHVQFSKPFTIKMDGMKGEGIVLS